MPDPIPAPGTTRATAPEDNGLDGERLGSLLTTTATIEATPKLDVTDTFTNLDNFVTVYGEPTITSGMLSGEGVVRHKNQALTDNHKASAVIGSLAAGTTRLFICADEAVKRYYALEITRSGSTNTFSIIKGSAASSVETGLGLLNLLFGNLSLVFSLFSVFSQEVTKYASTTVALSVSDEVSIWYDEANHTIRTYKNDVATACELPVPRGEIPHGPGNRWCGAATELDVFLFISNVGPRFTSIQIEDL